MSTPGYMDVETTATRKAPAPKAPEVVEGDFAAFYRKFSYLWSTVLLGFALVVLYYDIAQDWVGDFDDNGLGKEGSGAASEADYNKRGPFEGASEEFDKTSPWVNALVGSALLFWIALLEGAQVSIVGLTSVDIERFKDTHPRAYATCALIHRPATRVERFIVGRQFLLLFLVFTVSKMFGHSRDRQIHDDVDTNNGYFHMGGWEWHKNADVAFLQNGILVMIVIIIPGQLITQLIAAGKMLDFLELPYMAYYTVGLPSLFMEAIGITHTAYVIKDVAAWASGTEVPEDKKMENNFFHIIRCMYSIVAVIFSTIVVFYGLFNEQTNMWETLPPTAAFFMCLFFLFFIGCCEGFQIAAVMLMKLPNSQLKEEYPKAYMTTQLLNAGRNNQAFLVGRQVFVAMMMVLLAKVTSFKDQDENPFGFEEWAMDAFLESGILGAIFVVNVGQLSFRMMASCFPVLFIDNYVMYVLLRIALLVEKTGVVNACWPLAWGIDSMMGLKKDPDWMTEDGNATPSSDVLDRKKSAGIPITPGVAPFDLHQPEQEYNVEYSYKVSFI